MMHHRGKILPALLLVLTAGCGSGSIGNSGGGPNGNGPGGSSGGGPGGGGGSSGGMGNNPTPGASQFTCMPGIPATTQIPRMMNAQYDNVVHDLLGVTALATMNNQKPSQVLYADFQGQMVPDAWRLYQSTAATIASEVMGGSNKSNFISCDPSASGCLQQTIQTFGRKAFRRPLTSEEVTRFMKLGMTNPQGTPAQIAQTTLEAFLQSPSFLLLPELSEATPASGTGYMGYQLTSYEVATRLSFMLWGSVPDDTLNTAADNNQLQTKAQILAQAQRMIMVQNKTGPLIAAFHDDWVQQNNSGQHWWKNDHDTSKYPMYNMANKSTYQSELDAFWPAVAYAGGQFKDLFTSNIGFVNAATAPIYGLNASSYGTDLSQVQLDSNQRPGFMTRLGFLSSYSDYDATSPILRGAFIEVWMLGNNPGPPLAGAAMTPIPMGTYTTRRQEIDALVHTSSTCQTCHVTIINPAGYTLENYNAIGAWQTVDPLGGQIDATANVMFSQSDTHMVTSPLQLMQGIVATPSTLANYAQYWVTYGYGRAMSNQDQCVADQLNMKLSSSGYTILNVLADLTQADTFNIRVRATP
jgi:hypothetical protein